MALFEGWTRGEIAAQVGVTLIGTALLILAYCTGPSDAHDATNAAGQPTGWRYPWACCSSTDCEPIASTRVHETPDGYNVDGSSDPSPIPYSDTKRLKPSPDGTYHWCSHRAGLDQGKTICLFVLGGQS